MNRTLMYGTARRVHATEILSHERATQHALMLWCAYSGFPDNRLYYPWYLQFSNNAHKATWVSLLAYLWFCSMPGVEQCRNPVHVCLEKDVSAHRSLWPRQVRPKRIIDLLLLREKRGVDSSKVWISLLGSSQMCPLQVKRREWNGHGVLNTTWRNFQAG